MTRSEIGLEYLPQPDFLEFSLPKTHVALVTNDGSELTTKMIALLKEKGNQVVVLNLPNIPNPQTQNAVSIAANSDEAVKNAIQSVQLTYGKIGSFIHLHPHFEFQNGNFVQHFAAEKAVVKIIFFLAKQLQPNLN